MGLRFLGDAYEAQEAKEGTAYVYAAGSIDRYDVEVGVDVNFHVEHPELAFHDPDDDPLLEHVTRLVLLGTATYPADRAGERFELTIRGDDSPSTRVG
jgi:hypothetical protein